MALWLPYLAVWLGRARSAWFMKNFIDSIGKELDEATAIGGPTGKLAGVFFSRYCS
jgi:ABC-type maltose transport system permease subunit